jgi:adenine-specific DNA-methyltransferase
LIGVFDEIMEAYKRINKGETIFDFAKKKKILQNNIYGIDLDSKAIEIAKLNLMVKALDGMTTNDLKGKHLLPNLNLNIRVGNSVVNVESDMFNDYSDKINEIIDAKQKFYANEDYEISQKLLQNIFVLENFVNNKLIETSGIKNPEHIKPLNFSVIFCEVFKNGGFDAVVGNPPYLREKGHKKVFDIIKLGEYKKYLQGKMDYWYLFLRRAIDITKKEGKVGFITNSYFLKGSGASELIEKIKSDTVLNNAIDFDDIKIFGNVNGKHIIHTYIKKTPERSDKTEYTEIDKIQFNKFAPAVVGTIQKIPYLKIFDGAKISFDIDVVDYTKYKELGEFYEISQGVIEGSDKVSSKNNKKYKYNIGDGIFVLNSDELKMLNLQSDEKQFVKKYLDSKNVEKYKINFGKDYLLYITEDNCENVSKYKNIQNHLKKYKKIMDNRRETKKGTREWFQLHWSRESKFFDNPKLICMGMFNKPTFVYDDEKYYVGMSFSVIIQKDENYSLKYLLGILNSKFGEYWFNKHGKKRGVGVDIGVLVFRMFPICPASTEQQSKIEKIVNELTEIKAKITEDKKSNVKDKLELDFASKEIELNESIYTIYGFSPDEIDIIKEATK